MTIRSPRNEQGIRSPRAISASERPELSEFVCSTIASACNREPSAVRRETSLLSLDIDSLTFVSVLTQVEAVYGIDLEPDEIVGLLDASDIASLVAALATKLDCD